VAAKTQGHVAAARSCGRMRGYESRLRLGLYAEVCFAANITIASSAQFVRPRCPPPRRKGCN